MDKVINIGYGNQGLISRNDFYIEVPNAKVVLDNWYNDSYLDLFNTHGVAVWYEDDKERFIELFVKWLNI